VYVCVCVCVYVCVCICVCMCVCVCVEALQILPIARALSLFLCLSLSLRSLSLCLSLSLRSLSLCLSLSLCVCFELGIATVFVTRTPSVFDHRNQSLRDWIVDEYMMGQLGMGNRSAVDGFMLDDVSCCAPTCPIGARFTPSSS